MTLYAGAIYGLLLFAVIWIAQYFFSRRRASSALAGKKAMLEQPAKFEQQEETYRSFPAEDRQASKRAAEKAMTADNAVVRMKNLKELRDAGMISAAEYEQKRAEILKEI
ncbi:MAG: SHOCT domain-containing protein [Anaerolineales bacterium]